MTTLLILGDCQSNGNNCLAHVVLNNSEPRTWSLKFHNEFRSVFKWYLQHRKEHGVTTSMPTGNIEQVVWHYLWEEEQQSAWPNLLKIPNVVNMSINGAHFIGHHNRLKNYLKNNPKPDYVLITDYTFSHIAHSFKWQDQRYVFERENYIDKEWNPDRYPIEVHKKRLSGIAFQKSQSREWHIRRHKKGYHMLTKLLDHHNINWSTIRFGDPQNENTQVFADIMHPGIDCVSIGQQYMTAQGEDTEQKLKVQEHIAKIVQKHVDSC